MTIVANLCEHCAAEISYHRGRKVTVCVRCRLEGHTAPQETCEVCRRLDEVEEYHDECCHFQD
jgi:primosomal protein N'